MGWAGELVYVSAFALPALFGMYLSRRLHTQREEEAGVSLPVKWYLGLSAESLGLLLPLAIPVILCVMLVSILTTLLLSLFRVGTSAIEITSLPVMILRHALVPALLEEMLFRYVPLKLILPYSRRACIVISSLYFALIHCNLLSIPYALVAGVLFISLDIAFDSVLPSLILHFLNNTLSVIMMKYCNGATSYAIYFGVLALLLLASIPFVYRSRAKYREILKSILANEVKGEIGYYSLLLIIPTMLAAIMNLF